MNMKRLIAAILCTILTITYSKESNSTLLTSKIIGGQFVRFSSFAAFIKYRNFHKCGGALITEIHVITAAQCFIRLYPHLYEFTIVAGTNCLNPEPSVIEYSIGRVIFHPNIYESNAIYIPDMAVAVLRSPIVSLDIQDTVIQLSHDNILPGSIGTVAGWGYFRPYTSALNYSKRSNSLKKVDVRIIDNLECSRLLPNVRIHPSHICAVSAANNPENFANGDEGDPLVYRQRLIGVASFHQHDPRLPGVYTRISPYYHFLDNIINPRGPKVELSDTESYDGWSSSDEDGESCSENFEFSESYFSDENLC